MSSEARLPNPNHEALLWQAGRLLDDEEAPETPTAELEAYRRGELGADAVNRIEAALLTDGGLRRRLAASAGLDSAEAPPSEIRRRVLDGFADAMAERSETATPSAAGSGSESARTTQQARDSGKVLAFPSWKSARKNAGTWLAVAAALLIVVLLPLLPGQPEPLPENAGWQLSAEGLATVRGNETAETPSPTLELRPETWLRLDASPEMAIDDVEFGLFRERGTDIERLELQPSMLRIERGAVRIEAETASLLGDSAHRGRLYFVAAREGALPDAGDLRQAEPSELYRVYTLDYEILR